MDDETPAFVLYHDPPDEEQCTSQEYQQPQRLVLAEIRLPSSGSNCDSALKHEMFSHSEPLPPSDTPSESSSEEESKENWFLNSPQALSRKTPPRKLSASSTTPNHTRCFPLLSSSSPALTPHTPHSSFVSPFRI